MAGTNIDTEIALQFGKLANEDDLVQLGLSVKMHAADMQFSEFNQTKLMTVANELGRNVLIHGGGGNCRIARITSDSGKIGLRLVFKDKGPGISDLELALTDGYTSQKGLGLGLSGSKRMMDEFSIEANPGGGTIITAIKWL